MKYVNAGNGKMPLISLLAILSISLTINMPGLAVSPMLGKLSDVFHASELKTQLLTSLPNLCMIPVVLIAGKISTASRQTAVLTTGLMIFLIAGIACFFASSLNTLLVLGCFVGIGCGLVVPVAAGYISEWFMGSSRQADLGLKSTTSNAMVIVANIYVGIVAAHNWHAAFVVYLTPLIPLVLVPYMTQRYVNKNRIITTDITATNMAARDAEEDHDHPYHFQGTRSTWMLVSLICLYLFLTYSTTSISYYAPFCMKHYGMNTTQVGVVTSMYYLMCAVCGAFVSPLKKKFGKNTMFICLGLCAVGLLGIGFTHNFLVYTIASLITGFGYGIIQPIIYNKTTYVAPNRKLGTQYFGYVLSANYLSIMMVPFVDGAARKIFHATIPTFEFIFSGGVVCLILAWALYKRHYYIFAVNPASPAPTPAEIGPEGMAAQMKMAKAPVNVIEPATQNSSVNQPSQPVATEAETAPEAAPVAAPEPSAETGIPTSNAPEQPEAPSSVQEEVSQADIAAQKAESEAAEALAEAKVAELKAARAEAQAAAAEASLAAAEAHQANEAAAKAAEKAEEAAKAVSDLENKTKQEEA